MTTSPSLVTRRDERYGLRPGVSFVDFPDGRLGHGRTISSLSHVSAAGIQCSIDGEPPPFRLGESVEGVVVRIGGCRVRGGIVVKNISSARQSTDFGCLFVPDIGADEDRWMVLLVGIDASTGPQGGQP